MVEETTFSISNPKYLGVVENFFVNKRNELMHEISFYYLVEFIDDISNDDFTIVETRNGHETKHEFKSINISDLDNYDVRPAFLKKLFKSNNLEFNHLVINEIKDNT